MFDISSQAVEETAPLHIKSAAGEPLYADAERTKPAQIILYGPGSSAYAAVEARQTARAIKRMQDNDGKVTPPTADARAKEAAEDLAAITKGFQNFDYAAAGGVQGVPLFEALYLDQKLGFITRQVSKFVGDWGNFKSGSAIS